MRWVLDLQPGHYEIKERPDPGGPGGVFTAAAKVIAHKTTRLQLIAMCA